MIPAAFIITGPNIASQDLLFEQLSESLRGEGTSGFVRLRSSEAITLKAALKKTIHDAMASVGDADGDDLQIENARDVSHLLGNTWAFIFLYFIQVKY